MFNYIYIVLLSMGISLLGTMVGASLGMVIRKPDKRFLSVIMGLAGGLMLSVIVFELIPEGVEKIGMISTVLFYALGIVIVLFIEIFISKDKNQDSYSQMAFVTALGLMLHNLPEGIIMGSGFLLDKTLGIGMSLIIAIHDVPEGLAVTAPLMAKGVRISKIMFYAFVTALPTALGAAIGVSLGNVSDYYLGACLSLASGIMMYVVFAELIPESNKLWSGFITGLSAIIGLTLGFVMINLI
ncbi:ZIP family metal transporter [Alloiococcus sp. CFN-8]|uniref:ZIP family metal transporter n=1 Tax=Alloiococcus sp. CFN-8 TaxID=3416081 RepID=UPI003CFA8D55